MRLDFPPYAPGGMTFVEIGKELKISSERVRQMEQRGLRDIRTRKERAEKAASHRKDFEIGERIRQRKDNESRKATP